MTSFTVSSNDTSGKTLKSGETGTVTSSGNLNPSGVAVTWDLSGSTGTATITNSGTLKSTGGRTIDTSNSAGSAQSLSITNNATGIMSASTDWARIQKSLNGGSITIANSGSIAGGTGRGINVQEYSGLAGFSYTGAAGSTFQSQGDVIRLTSATTALAFTGTLTITNSGTIKSTGTGSASGQALDLNDLAATSAGHIHVTNNAGGVMEAADADAIRTGAYALIDNYGTIQGKNGTPTSTSNDGIDAQANVGVVINNYQGGSIIGARHGITGSENQTITNDGTITGQLGGGINLDTPSGTTTITNNVHGVITGNTDGTVDADGIDVDHLVTIINHGTIRAVGIDPAGELNEALAIGGGTVSNDGLIASDQRAITVDDSNLGGAFAALNLTNSGTITGNNGEAIHITGTQADSITNSGTINGSIFTDDGADTLTNSGTINGAIDMGAGNDTVNWNSLVTGTVDGGAGTDALAFNGTFNGASGSASFTNFESVSGTLTGTGGSDVLNLAGQTWTGSLTVNAGDGTDTVTGGSEADTINGGNGDDTLTGNTGNDIIDGGAGFDTAIFNGTYASYTVSRVGTTVTLSGADGSDTVSNVENFQFSDGIRSVGQMGNLAPTLTGSQAVLTHGTEDSSYVVTVAQLLTGYSDGNSDTLSVTSLSADHGTVIDNLDGTYSVTPAANYNGAMTLSYNVVDGNGGSAAVSLGYTVDAVNDAPALTSAQTTLAHGSEDTAYVVAAADLLTGFSDVDGDGLSVSGLSADYGTVVDNLDGTYSVTPAANYNGPMVLSYSVADGNGASIAATLDYAIDAVNDAPVLTGAQATLAHAGEDAAYIVSISNLLAGFSDVDGDSLSVSGLTADHGTVTDNLDGTYTVTPVASFGGTMTLSYSVVDGNGGSVAATLDYIVDLTHGGTFTGTSGNDPLTGTNFDDVLIGLAGNDALYGLDGNDVLNGGINNDTLDGGNGIDTASYADSTKGVTVDLAIASAQNTAGQGIDTLISIENLLGSNYADKLSGNAGDNVLDGGSGADQLYGRAGNDHLLGGAGNDILDGGIGADLMEGGLGSDKYYVDDAGDVVIEGAGTGTGTDWVYATIDYTLTANVEKLTLIDGGGNLSGTGNDLNNTIFGNDGNNVLNGKAGADVLTGGAGADTFVFDVLETSAHKDTIKDFVSGTDHIELSVSAFTGLAGYGLGTLNPGELTYGAKATTFNQHLIYNTTTGVLSYDADGVGGQAQVQIAVLTAHPSLAAGDIVLV